MAQKNRVRIVGGDFRRRQIRFVDGEDLRPSGDRVRETLFNWLQNFIPGARVLDLYSGSGALGIEALSRGASWADLVDSNREAVAAIRENLQALAITNAGVFHTKAEHWLQENKASKTAAYDQVFLDPPFARQLWPEISRQLEDSGVMKDSCKIYLEADRDLDVGELPDNWQLERSKKSGQVYYYLFSRTVNR